MAVGLAEMEIRGALNDRQTFSGLRRQACSERSVWPPLAEGYSPHRGESSDIMHDGFSRADSRFSEQH